MKDILTVYKITFEMMMMMYNIIHLQKSKTSQCAG